ncbi:envelope stress response membrane protein PspB [Sphingomonas morindae]|uniref:Envelope stress response membrane protein PspB n=1 Tax=Sphingomonas morindae TaxID=1541170 RepID=A0ABY4X836_9SPHN|nr:envelope stress response membrane protein PspB [Sphingomonas morindae]USI73087.1 envelope stress response membrane protein PspB [Sphingomonas morindae]
MEDVLLPIVICGMLFIGVPWIILHYVTQWRRARGLSVEDENLLDGLHDMARRLDERLATIERIVAADDPHWRASSERPDRPERRLPEGDWPGHA